MYVAFYALLCYVPCVLNKCVCCNFVAYDTDLQWSLEDTVHMYSLLVESCVLILMHLLCGSYNGTPYDTIIKLPMYTL